MVWTLPLAWPGVQAGMERAHPLQFHWGQEGIREEAALGPRAAQSSPARLPAEGKVQRP